MKTILEITLLAADFLAKKGLASPRLEAEYLVAESLGMKRLEIYVDYDRPVTEAEQAKIRPYLERRGKREPLQYLFEEVSFLDCPFKVNPSVLIPRPETEILADKIVKEIKNPAGKILWDLCTGSGCLGISIKKKLPELTVVLSDLCPQALKVARENAALNQVDVEFLEGDLLVPFKGRRAHYVVSNPPYVTEDEYLSLEPEVKDFEPKSALVSGTTGKEFYQRLANELPYYLEPGGVVWMELGPADTETVFTDSFWKERFTEPDWSGQPRFLTARTHLKGASEIT